MVKNKKQTLAILIDLHYKFSMNHFEEFYGDSVTYSSIEQESYIDLKEMSFEKINRSIKFRKFGRHNNVLTIKMDIKIKDYELFLNILKNEENKDLRFNFLHDFIVSNPRILTSEERIKFKKVLSDEDYEEEYEENFNEDDIVIDTELDLNNLEVIDLKEEE